MVVPRPLRAQTKLAGGLISLLGADQPCSLGIPHRAAAAHAVKSAIWRIQRCTTSSFAAAPSSTAPAAPAFTGDVAIDGGRIAAVGGKAGPARRVIDARRPVGHARLGRCPHPLRRPGDLGPDPGAVLLARRDDDPVRQLRRRVRAGPTAPPRGADRLDGRGRGHPGPGPRRRPQMGLGELSRFSRRARTDAADDRRGGAGPASPAARLCDGRPRDPPRGGHRRRHRCDAEI